MNREDVKQILSEVSDERIERISVSYYLARASSERLKEICGNKASRVVERLINSFIAAAEQLDKSEKNTLIDDSASED